MNRSSYHNRLILTLASPVAIFLISTCFAVESPAPPSNPVGESDAALPGNIKRLVHHGQILSRPAAKPEGTQREVAYELGTCYQLDRDHCLLVASMDEQGGGDLCVGNDGFVIQKLADIAAEKAIPLNRAVQDYSFGPDTEHVFLAKYPAFGTFIPLGAQLPGGKPHPAAGTGLLFSCCSTFRADKSTQDETSKRFVEIMQLRWDGSQLTIVHREIVSKMFDLNLTGSTPLASCTEDDGLLCPFVTAPDGIVIYRFDWNGKRWAPNRRSQPFAKSAAEQETSLRRQGTTYYLQTRCKGFDGNLYRADKNLNFEFVATLNSKCGCPKVLNQGLDGTLYVACNYSPGWVRNPLYAVPLATDHFEQPFLLHDQDGVRNDKGDSSPFVDHAIASNVFLEGRWRHLLFYRVCDLKERTLHGFQLKQGFGDVVYGKGRGPIPRRPWSGMYAIELEYDHITDPPFQFAN